MTSGNDKWTRAMNKANMPAIWLVLPAVIPVNTRSANTVLRWFAFHGIYGIPSLARSTHDTHIVSSSCGKMTSGTFYAFVVIIPFAITTRSIYLRTRWTFFASSALSTVVNVLKFIAAGVGNSWLCRCHNLPESKAKKEND